jgi:rRNA pseudouridine-1189 N-methylase Emg1 (Nep1/Mra1 family)
MAVLDSPLNKAGKIKLYMHTEKNVLVEINAKTRLPRTFKRFSGLMVRFFSTIVNFSFKLSYTINSTEKKIQYIIITM